MIVHLNIKPNKSTSRINYDFKRLVKDYVSSYIKDNKDRIKDMDYYLQHDMKLKGWSTFKVISHALDNTSTYKVEDGYDIKINLSKKIKNDTLRSILGLIEWGNLRIKGIKCFSLGLYQAKEAMEGSKIWA